MRRDDRQNRYAIVGLPFYFHQQSPFMWHASPTTAQMATYFGSAVGVTAKMSHIAILTSVAKSPFGNEKWQQSLELTLEQV
jgi:hypothetical protein